MQILRHTGTYNVCFNYAQTTTYFEYIRSFCYVYVWTECALHTRGGRHSLVVSLSHDQTATLHCSKHVEQSHTNAVEYTSFRIISVFCSSGFVFSCCCCSVLFLKSYHIRKIHPIKWEHAALNINHCVSIYRFKNIYIKRERERGRKGVKKLSDNHNPFYVYSFR